MRAISIEETGALSVPRIREVDDFLPGMGDRMVWAPVMRAGTIVGFYAE